MRSFTIWCTTNNKEDNSINRKATVHINLWDKPEEDAKKYCFDFGVLLEDIRNIENIYLYVPFQIEQSEIKDLGITISNNRLVNAIFNENFTTTDGEPKRLIVNGTEEKPKFIIYSLDVQSQIELRSCVRSGDTDIPGTILQIKLSTIAPKEIFRYYFRFRIQVDNRDVDFINDEIKGVSIFSNQFTTTEVIDFRLNDIRSCSEELREQFDKGELLQILAVHYLILRNANDEIIHYGKEMNSRMLENDLWNGYIEGTDKNIIAYHIKSKADCDKYIESFSDLTRFRYQKGTKLVILIYIIVIIGLGAIGGVIGNWLSKLLNI